jgi:hypothetical protein
MRDDKWLPSRAAILNRRQQIRETKFETARYPGAPHFSPGGPKALLATMMHKGESSSIR